MTWNRLTVIFLVMIALFVCCQAAKVPYPYYERPPYRYPYYDNTGKGQLLYGYGGSELYAYNKFTPLEGIYRR